MEIINIWLVVVELNPQKKSCKKSSNGANVDTIFYKRWAKGRGRCIARKKKVGAYGWQKFRRLSR